MTWTYDPKTREVMAGDEQSQEVIATVVNDEVGYLLAVAPDLLELAKIVVREHQLWYIPDETKQQLSAIGDRISSGLAEFRS